MSVVTDGARNAPRPPPQAAARVDRRSAPPTAPSRWTTRPGAATTSIAPLSDLIREVGIKCESARWTGWWRRSAVPRRSLRAYPPRARAAADGQRAQVLLRHLTDRVGTGTGTRGGRRRRCRDPGRRDHQDRSEEPARRALPDLMADQLVRQPGEGGRQVPAR